ncbi:MAG: EFR1 family ferrodoxin [Candidatus Delongbacteria bacterium]|nr:EFR1 family ferrodoxin [Candidatus Delongbacteria bacterium]
MKVLYFTATGNSLYVAKRLADRQGVGEQGELLSIPRLMKMGVTSLEDDRIGIVCPCYFLGTPDIVMEFLRKVRLRASYIFAVMTYGGFPGEGVGHLVRMAERAGIRIDYSNQILMVDNYLPMFDIAREIREEPNKHSEEHLESILHDIRNTRRSHPARNPIMRVISFFALKSKEWMMGGKCRNFWITEACNGCGICVEVCPVDNIRLDPQPVFNDGCIYCMACINLCPINAIQSKRQKSKDRFMNRNVTLGEIKEANRTVDKSNGISI